MAEAGSRGVLITRPSIDAGPLTDAVRARGLDPVIAPLLEIVETGGELRLEDMQVLLLTSANGARALARATERRDFRIFAVGEATAAAARAAGFDDVAVADGDWESLAALVRESCDPAAGPLVHAVGRDVAGDLAGALESAGFTVERAVLYRAEAAGTLPEAARAALAGGTVGAALFFSPRTAQSFVILAEQAGVGAACRAVSAICLSSAVAEAAKGLDWAETRIAVRPDLDALLACLDSWVSDQSPEKRVTETPKDKDGPWNEAGGAGDSSKGADEAEPKREAAAETRAAADAKARPAPSSASRATQTRPASSGRARGVTAAWTLTGLLAVLVVAGAAYITWPLWRGDMPGWARGGLAPVMEVGRGGPAGRIDALEERLRAVQDAVAKIGARPSRAGPSSPDAAKVTALAQEMERLTAEVESLRAAVQPLVARVDAVEQANRSGGGSGEELAGRIEALEKRIGTMARQQAGGGEAVASIRAESEKRIAALAEENRTLSEGLAKLRQRLDELESRSRARSGAAEGAALIAATAGLRDAVETGQSYAQALKSVRALVPEGSGLTDTLDALGRYAEQGVATRDELRRRFQQVASAVSQAAIAPEGSGWVDQTIARLSSLVTIRRTGEEAAQEDSVGGRLARAELRLSAGDLQGAVAALEGLSGAPARAAADWLAAANARLMTETALGAVSAAAISRLAGGAKGAAGG